MPGTHSALSWPGIRRDPDFWSLVGFNLAAVAATVAFGVGAWQLLLAYWADSVALGLFNAVRMLSVPYEPLTADPPPKEKRQFFAAKIGLTLFFLVHYGGFHAIYLLIMNESVRDWFGARGPIDAQALAITIGALALHRIVVFFREHRAKSPIKLPAGSRLPIYMFLPYGRVVPMHLLIMGGAMVAHVLGASLMGVLVAVFLFALRMVGEFIPYVVRRALMDGRDA